MDAFGSNWPASGTESTTLSGELSLSSSPARKSRSAERVQVEFGAGLRQRGAAGVTVQIVDLSITGFRVATHLGLDNGTDVWLRLPGLEPCHAKVAWSKGHFVGCEFERPLHPAVLDMVVRKARSR